MEDVSHLRHRLAGTELREDRQQLIDEAQLKAATAEAAGAADPEALAALGRIVEEFNREGSDDLGWAIVELMGHRRLAGYVSEQEIAGAAFLRLDVPSADDQGAATQLYSASAVYCITPTSEKTARAVAAGARPAPVSRWELPSPREREDIEDADLADEAF